MTSERRKQISRESYLRNKEKVLQKSKERYYANREKRSDQIAAYRKLHPEVALKACKKHWLSHKDKRRKSTRDWYQRNIESERTRIRLKAMHRRALIRGAAVNLASIERWMRSVKSKPTCRCYYCESVIPTDTIHFDHIVPLSKGGSHSVENLCVSCAYCNLSKKDLSISAWVRIGQQVLSL